MNPAGAAGMFERELAERGFSTKPGPGERLLQLTGMREYAQACGALADDVRNGRWRHLGQGPVDAAGGVGGVRAPGGFGVRWWARARAGDGAAVGEAAMGPVGDLGAWSWAGSEVDCGRREAMTRARRGLMTQGVRPPAEPDIF